MRDHEEPEREPGDHVKAHRRVGERTIEGHRADRPRQAEARGEGDGDGGRDAEEHARRETAPPERATSDPVFRDEAEHEREPGDLMRDVQWLGEADRGKPSADAGAQQHGDRRKECEVHQAPRHSVDARGAARWQTHHVSQRDLLVLTEEPLNAETRLDRQRGVITPAGRHYVRSHFPIPIGPTVLELDGARRIELSLAEIRAMPSRTVRVTLECAGNGRRFLEPAVPGEQWGLGAVGTAEWTGVPLARLLEEAGLRPNTAEVLFRGADRGTPKDLDREIAFERSLPIADALREDVMVAYAMNGAPVAREHGGPLRLVVAGWYGMASVKWLAAIALLERPFSGFFQADRYVIDGRPLREIAPRAVIASPGAGNTGSNSFNVTVQDTTKPNITAPPNVTAEATGPNGAIVNPGQATASDIAGPVTITGPATGQYPLGTTTATWTAADESGNAQPLTARWNPLGYANNAVHPVRVRMRG